MKILHSLIICALALALSGCKAVNGEQQADIERISRVAKEAATVGTQEALLAHPEWRESFETVVAELFVLETSESVGLDGLLDVINRLPVKELQSRDARLTVTGARLLISSIDVPEVDAERIATLRPIVRSIREGIENGLPQ